MWLYCRDDKRATIFIVGDGEGSSLMKSVPFLKCTKINHFYDTYALLFCVIIFL